MNVLQSVKEENTITVYEKKLSQALFSGKVKEEQDVAFRRCYSDAAKGFEI